MRIIAGEARSRVLETPRGLDTRPTLDRVRENIFNIIRGDVPGARVLDLFAGSGAMALEALSRGAAFAVLVDHDRAAGDCEKRNVEKLRYGDKTRLMRCDWRQAVGTLAGEGEAFDLIFLDPPYSMAGMDAVTEALKPLMAPDALMVTEHRAGCPYPVAEGYLQTDSRRWGVAGVSFYRLMKEEQP